MVSTTSQPLLLAAAPGWASSLLLVLAGGLVLGGLVLLVAIVASASRAPGGLRGLLLGEPSRAGDETSPALRREIERIEQVMTDAQELTQVLAAQLDTQAARLETLIETAQAKINRLEQLQQQTAQPRHAQPAIPTIPAPPVRAHEAVAVFRHQSHADSGATTDPLTAEIYRLADDGLPPIEIAKRLSQHTGKVELILALRQP